MILFDKTISAIKIKFEYFKYINVDKKKQRTVYGNFHGLKFLILFKFTYKI